MRCFNCGEEEDDHVKLTGYCRECFDKFAELFEAEHRIVSNKDEVAAAVLIGLVICIAAVIIGGLL